MNYLEKTSKSIEKKLAAPDAKRCIYHNLTSEECLVFDYGGRWNDKSVDIDELREDFYTRILPLAKQNGDLDSPKYEEMYRDYGWSSTYLGRGRELSAFYTEHGIRRIDTYLSNRVMNMTNLEESHIVEKEIMLCPHLHIYIKENLLLNLTNYTKDLAA